MANISLRCIILYVHDVEKACTFYEQAFGLKRVFITEDNMYGELDTGSTKLSFVAREFVKGMTNLNFADAKDIPQAFEICFESTDVPGNYQKCLDHGASDIAAPAQKPWGQSIAYVRDPDGYTVEICSPMKPLA